MITITINADPEKVKITEDFWGKGGAMTADAGTCLKPYGLGQPFIGDRLEGDKVDIRDLKQKLEDIGYGIKGEDKSQKGFDRDFSWAVSKAKNLERICRAGWNGKGMWVSCHLPLGGEFITHPFLYIEYPKGHPAYPEGSRIPWLASQSDLMATDWMIYQD